MLDYRTLCKLKVELEGDRCMPARSVTPGKTKAICHSPDEIVSGLILDQDINMPKLDIFAD